MSIELARIIGHMSRLLLVLLVSSFVVSIASAEKPADDVEALFLAAGGDRLEDVTRLLSTGIDVNVRDRWDRTPLMVASEHGRISVVRFLLQKGADVNAIGNAGAMTALSVAARNGYEDLVELLLDKGANVNAKIRYMGSALIEAANAGEADVVKLLLEKGADVNARDQWKDTALMKAAQMGEPETVEVLLQKATDSVERREALEIAAQYDHPAVVEALRAGGVGLTLSVAAMLGDLEACKRLIAEGADVNQKSRGYTPLMRAVEQGNREIVQLLLDKGADPGLKDEYGRTVLEGGRAEIVKLLLSRGVALDAKDLDKALLRAAEAGNVEVVRLLLDFPTRTAKDRGDLEPLVSAARQGHVEVVRLLLEKGMPTESKHGNNALDEAAWEGRLEVVKLLLDNGVTDSLKYGCEHTALVKAAGRGHIEIVKLLLQRDAGAKRKKDCGQAALLSAAEKGSMDVAKLLKERGIDCSGAPLAAFFGNLDAVRREINSGEQINDRDWEGRTILMWAVSGGDPKMVKFLWDKGADVNADTGIVDSHLMVAAKHGHLEVVKLLLDKGADVNAYEHDSTPLMEAAGHLEVAKLLLDKGADVDSGDQHGVAPLHLAAGAGHLDMVRLLLDKGADVNADTLALHGGPPLHWAARRGNSEVVKLLVERGSDINEPFGVDITTALTEAVEAGKLEVVRVLLENGAHVNHKKEYGVTALKIAKKKGYRDIGELLRSHGAK